MTRSTKDMQICYDEEGNIAALYVAGKLAKVGKPYAVEDAAFALLDVQRITGDASLRGGRRVIAAVFVIDVAAHARSLYGGKASEIVPDLPEHDYRFEMTHDGSRVTFHRGATADDVVASLTRGHQSSANPALGKTS